MSALAPQFFLPALHGGGAESHLLRILNAWPCNSPLPSLWLARRGGSYEAQLRADVELRKVRSTRKFGATMSVLSCVPALRQMIRGKRTPVCPVLDFAVLALDLARRALPRRQRPPLVILLQNNLGAMLADLRAPWKYLRGAILRAHRDSDGIVFLSDGVRQDFLKLIPDYAGRTAVIPNATWSDELDARSREACPVLKPAGKKVIVSCGRMHRQKGFDILLSAFAKTSARGSGELWLLGEGPNRAALEAQATALGIAASVRFLGFQTNPLAYFRAADLFVLSSRWEGFGNVVVEALGCGAPVLSTNCPYGPAEVLEDCRWGKLVPVEDADALASGINDILGDAELSAKLSAGGPMRARQFEAGPIAQNYAEFLTSFHQ